MKTFVLRAFFALSLAVRFLPGAGCAQETSGQPPQPKTPAARPEPAIPGILRAFDTYEVVAMPAAHGEKDIDDLILSLLRDPRFPYAVNDVVVECGNMRYQSILDRYIAGDDVSFAEVRHVWRDTTVQQMCGVSGFYEQLFPLIRSLNRQLPPSSRLRVVAADPPIDWKQIHSYDDLRPFFDRDGNIASVIEKEVLSKHRKALMLFGYAHLIHGGGPGEGDAVTRYERNYPGRTFVIGEFWNYDVSKEALASVSAPGGIWPSLVRSKGSRFGTLPLDSFIESPLTTDKNCNVREAFPSDSSQTVAERIDAFVYLGSPKAPLTEPIPADVALDSAYMTEWLRRMKLVGLPGPSTVEEWDAQIVAGAGHEPAAVPTETKHTVSAQVRAGIRQSCLSGIR